MGVGYSYEEFNKNNYFINDRLIDANISIGISDSYQQCIRINGSQLYSLTRMITCPPIFSNQSRIILEFEDDIKLCFLFKKESQTSSKIFYELIYPGLEIHYPYTIFMRSVLDLKPFNSYSDEFDHLINKLRL